MELSKRAYRALAAAIRPVLAIPFPGRWRVFASTINVPANDRHWRGAPLEWTRCKNTGQLLPCDLSVFSGRIAWYFRRWYEIDTQSAIATLLPRGGTFIDIGGNVGMASLAAADAIGPDGRIIAFEPNPSVAAIHAQSIRRNGLDAVWTLRNAAIAESEGTMTLFVPTSNHGEASLATGFVGREGKEVTVAVTTASDLAELDRVDLVKIDVEGFELSVLKALRPMLNRHHPPVITELMDEHLSRAGTSSREVAELMAGLGYRAYRLTIEDADLLRQRAGLVPIDAMAGGANCNALWVFEPDAARIEACDFRALRK